MTVSQYLDANSLTQVEFARQIGVDQATVHRMTKGHVPSSAVIEAIMRATSGAVSANDFFPPVQARAA